MTPYGSAYLLVEKHYTKLLLHKHPLLIAISKRPPPPPPLVNGRVGDVFHWTILYAEGSLVSYLNTYILDSDWAL